MNEKERSAFYERYENGIHVIGRVGLSLGILLMLAAPLAMGWVLGAGPDWAAFGMGFFQVAIIYWTSGVLCLVPLTPVLEAPALQPAFNNVIPALFGALAFKYFYRNMNIAIIPLVFMCILFVAAPGLIGSVSFLILLSGAMAIGIAYWLFKHGKLN